MTVRRNSATLPDEVQALWFVCRCVGICEKDFPSVPRSTLRRAVSGQKIAASNRNRIRLMLETALFERFRRPSSPISHTNNVTDQIVSNLLSLYRRIRPRLSTDRVAAEKVLWIVTEHVVIPTVFTIVAKARQGGTGTEFQGAECWYLPSKSHTPIQRVLDFWLRTAGLVTAHGLSKRLHARSQKSEAEPIEDPNSLKKRIQRWLTGEVKPSFAELDRIMDDVANAAPEVRWLDGAVAWKARLRLAFAIQTACELACGAFSKDVPLQFASLFKDEINEPTPCDLNGFLSTPHSYFAARLYARQLQRIGRLEEVLRYEEGQICETYGPEVSDHEIKRRGDEIMWQMHPGCRFLAFIEQQAQACGVLKGRNATEDFFALDEFLFDLGIQELNGIIKKKRSRRA